MNIRKDLAAQLREKLPDDWTVLDVGVALENPLRPVVVIRQQDVKRNAGAPRKYRDKGFVVALVEPGLAVDLVEDALDDDVVLLLDALEDLPMPGLIWTEAERVTFQGRFAGYDVHVTITTEKED